MLRETSTVSLVHSTQQDYLHAQPDILPNAHAEIADVCLTYLNFDSVKHLAPSLHITPSILPFAESASYYWEFHATMKLTKFVKSIERA